MNTTLFGKAEAATNSALCRRVWPLARGAFCLLLAGLVLADLARSGIEAGQYLRTPILLAGVSPLDSFSKPSTAAAILKQEAETLLFEYTEARNATSTQDPSVMEGSRHAANQGQPATHPIHFTGFARGSALEVARIRPLERLQVTAQNLNLELYQDLLFVYSENHFDNELVDTFLRLLRVSPECPEVLQWVRAALDSSQPCGRTMEVEDALQHTLRFHPTLKTAAQLAALKQSWDAEHLNAPGA
jgi:hypothetical protein